MKYLPVVNAMLLVLWIASCQKRPDHGGSGSFQPVQDDSSQVNGPEDDAAPVTMHPGRIVYDAICLTCHQADGSGVPMMYPPLIESDWATGDKERLIKLILEGTQGPVEVKGEVYNSIMPPQNQLTNRQVADLLTYLRSDFGNAAGPVTPEEVEAVRKKTSGQEE